MRLITPKRLKENEEFMWRLADRQIDEFLDRGECEFIHDYANPFTLLVIADLLGVPEADHETFREELQGERARPQRAKAGEAMAHKPLEFLYERFTAYIEERRREPRDDVMTELATATFPDGSLPEVSDVMLIAGNLFAAGQETTARLLGSGAPVPRPSAPSCSSCSATSATASRASSRRRCGSRARSRATSGCRACPTTVGGVDLPAGTTVMLLNGAANRDPREFERPGRAPPRPGERSPAPRVRVRHPHLRRRAARPGRGARDASSASSTAWATSGSRRRRTARPAPAATSTRRSTCSAAWSSSSSSSRR